MGGPEAASAGWGWGRSLNPFPDLYIAFYRWALWKLFDREGSDQRGVLSFITNRGFLTGKTFAGLRQMLRRRFDRIEIVDLRGDNAGAAPADITTDENVFNIEVGVCVLTGWSRGPHAEGHQAEVFYADAWGQGAFTRAEKLALMREAAADPMRLSFVRVRGTDLDPLKPRAFAPTGWPSLRQLFTYSSNGVVTYRDHFAYAFDVKEMKERLQSFHAAPLLDARREFSDSTMNSADRAHATRPDFGRILNVAYRPLDRRVLYNRSEFVDRPRDDMQAAWGRENLCLFALEDGTGTGPAVWCHGLIPDQHAFRGSYGGWLFPLFDHSGTGSGHYIAASVLPTLTAAYGRPVWPQELFDAILALLSGSSYTRRFARGLEDEFPHVPLPSDGETFARAAAIGAEIRALETFARLPADTFRIARVVGSPSAQRLAVPSPRRAWLPADGGSVLLLADGSVRITGVPERVWNFCVSDFQVMHKWLAYRSDRSDQPGQPFAAGLYRQALDVANRIEELLHWFDAADTVLESAVVNPLTAKGLGL